MNPRVTVFSPGSVRNAYQGALACYEGGILEEYITSLYYKPYTFPYSFLKYLPERFADQFKRQAIRRYVKGLDESFVKTYPFYEFLHLLSRRIDKELACKIMRYRDYALDKKVGELLDPQKTNVLLTFDTPAFLSFEQARRKGIKCVLGQRIGHFEAAERILTEEAELNPDFASTLNYVGFLESEKEALRKQIELADYILVISNFVYKTFLDAGIAPEKLVKIPLGVEIDKFASIPDKESDNIFRILFVGQIGQRKGIKYLLEAFKQLSLPKSELIFIGNIVGDKNSLAPYEGYFRHIDHVPHNELPEYYSKCDVFVFPSLFEGFSLVVLEAMASGVPVIVSENAGSNDVVRDGVDGFVVPIRDVEALKEKILFFYENKDFRDEMGKNARMQTENYTWKNYRKRLVSTFLEICRDKQ